MAKLPDFQKLTLADDVFQRTVFPTNQYIPEYICSVFLDRPIQFTEFSVQKLMSIDPGKKEVWFDVYGLDEEANVIIMDTQNTPPGPDRFPVYGSLAEAYHFLAGQSYQDSSSIYIILLLKNGKYYTASPDGSIHNFVFHSDIPIYTFVLMYQDSSIQIPFHQHYLFVNGKCKADTRIGKVIQSMFQSDPDKIKDPVLAKFMKKIKSPEGVKVMQEEFQKYVDEQVKQATEKVAKEAAEKAAQQVKAVTEKAAQQAKEAAEKAAQQAKYAAEQEAKQNARLKSEQNAKHISQTMRQMGLPEEMIQQVINSI